MFDLVVGENRVVTTNKTTTTITYPRGTHDHLRFYYKLALEWRLWCYLGHC